LVQKKVKKLSKTKIDSEKLKVVCIIGSGLTNATATRVAHGTEISMSSLMNEILTTMETQENLAHDNITGPLINKLIDFSGKKTLPNLEELIDLLDSSGHDKCILLAKLLSENFARILTEHMNKMINEGLRENLAEIIIDYFNTEDNPEKLLGILTTNYDH